MRHIATITAAFLLTLAGCASVRQADTPTVSVINSLSFDNAVTGRRDGLRSAWPLDSLNRATEHFPLAQVKQCDTAGVCSWGVLKSQRSFSKVRQVPGGVALEVDVQVEVDRSLQADHMNLSAAVTIPADVGALQSKVRVKREVVLEFGKVERIDFDFGIRYELCALRLDAARKPVDTCPIAYF